MKCIRLNFWYTVQILFFFENNTLQSNSGHHIRGTGLVERYTAADTYRYTKRLKRVEGGITFVLIWPFIFYLFKLELVCMVNNLLIIKDKGREHICCITVENMSEIFFITYTVHRKREKLFQKYTVFTCSAFPWRSYFFSLTSSPLLVWSSWDEKTEYAHQSSCTKFFLVPTEN